ncbi:hypothetical protein NBRC3279_1719 [Acetobacter pasteurianus NBRC 3279]|nr:hypothetical protein NBRC3279_1719 [Acetobacter pasteurianus NBRC 3279]GCD72537.1 hypothetical protein NBRC3284_1693 [Acetobacter pasteurianus NBRC 3284]
MKQLGFFGKERLARLSRLGDRDQFEYFNPRLWIVKCST